MSKITMTDNDKSSLIEKLHDLAKPEIIRNNRISIDWLAIIDYITQYGDQSELAGLNKVLNDIEPEGIVMQGNMMMYKCNVELLLTNRIAELKSREDK